MIEPEIQPDPQTVKPTMKNPSGVSQPSPVKVKPASPRTPAKPASPMYMGGGDSLNGNSTGNPAFDDYIVRYSRQHGIDPLLTFAQMHQESTFNKKATSYKGASGLMQLMPGTAKRFGVTDIYDPEQNIMAGTKYMKFLLNKFGGDVNLALAGYNAGEGAVMKYGNKIPPYRETQDYVARITKNYNRLRSGTAKQTRTQRVIQRDLDNVRTNFNVQDPFYQFGQRAFKK